MVERLEPQEKKTIWIANEYNPPGQRRSRQTVLAQRLEERGYRVYVIAGSKVHGADKNLLNRTEKYKHVSFDGADFIIINVPNYSRNYQRVCASLIFQYRLWNWRKDLPKPDIIVSDFAGLFGNVFLKWKKRYGTKVIYDILDLWPEAFVDVGFIKNGGLLAKLLYALEHKTYREADGVVFSFEGGKDYIVEKGWDTGSGGDVALNKVGYLNNGVDLETVDQQRDTLILQDADLDTDKFKVVYLGSIRRANDLDIVVEAAKELAGRGETDIVLLVYGDGDLRPVLEEKARAYGLTNIKIKGRLPVEYAPNMLSRCDVCLFNFMNVPVARFGLSPNKLFMYFASGKPVLSTIKPKYDLVSGRGCGIVVDNSPEALANGIIRFSKMSKEEYAGYAKNCRLVAKEFDYRNLVNVLLNMIEGKQKNEQ